ncbi:MAG TPA: hypothetical protein VHZ27_14140 [Solirubrobacteraceae bacterium]|nr:hypothetical protein [Solirubrobacteraceae bacterium]
MPRSVRRFSLLSGVALCAILAGPIAGAQASDNTIRATLNHYGPIICAHENAAGRCTKGEEAAVTNGLDGYPASHERLVRALGHELATLRAMKRTLVGESASSARGAKGRSDIIKGVTLIIDAYAALRHDVQVANGGPVPASKVNPIVNTDKKGRSKLQAGLNLLTG